jgi:hypothetical protein
VPIENAIGETAVAAVTTKSSLDQLSVKVLDPESFFKINKSGHL